MLTPGQLCRVYYNLHQKKLSVQTKVDSGWRVTDHLDSVYLVNARFIVSAAGRDRVRREGRKNVHAFVQGEYGGTEPLTSGVHVSYNPYLHDCFTRTDTQQPVQSGDMVSISGRRILAVLS